MTPSCGLRALTGRPQDGAFTVSAVRGTSTFRLRSVDMVLSTWDVTVTRHADPRRRQPEIPALRVEVVRQSTYVSVTLHAAERAVLAGRVLAQRGAFDAFVVDEADLVQPLQGCGLGGGMYRLIVHAAAPHLVLPHAVYPEGSTSTTADRVWRRLYTAPGVRVIDDGRYTLPAVCEERS